MCNIYLKPKETNISTKREKNQNERKSAREREGERKRGAREKDA